MQYKMYNNKHSKTHKNYTLRFKTVTMRRSLSQTK